MIKFVIAALWLVAVTLGTVIFSFSMSGPRAVPTPFTEWQMEQFVLKSSAPFRGFPFRE